MRRTAAILVTLGLALAACGSDDDTSSFCESRAEVGQSVSDLRDLSVLDDGLDAVEAQLATVSDDVDTLKAAATELQPEVDAVRASLDGLRTAVEAAPTVAEQATALVAGLEDLAATWTALDDAASSECD